MPSRPTPLPADLASGGPFTLADARVRGILPGRLRGRDLEAPTSGVRRAAEQPADLASHVRSFLLALPDDVAIGHLTAARLHRLPTPAPWPGPDEPVHVVRESSRPRIERQGCVHHRGLESREQVCIAGVRATSAVDTWCDLASWSEPCLLAAADVLLRRGLATNTSLAAAATARRGRRHAGRLRSAAALARPGAASPGESLARWWFHGWRLPEPELNAAVLDDHGGWLATGDFVWRRQRVVGEFDGDVHRTDRRAWQRDRERRSSIEDARWTYVDMTSMTFASPHRREALRRRLVRLLGTVPPTEGWRSVASGG